MLSVNLEGANLRGADLRGTAMVDVNMHAADVAGLRRE
jgi:uncharacterized protein YjbI with pentapeptide repeats